ncbi:MULTISPECIES: hypothetical protein [unclassified Sinorhizobium]|uniref:hypothetical protein n=1 Tax=unclassified Sinorhizobium TaxID=2613772 RepID=UPI0035234F5D
MAKTDRKPANPGAVASTDLSRCKGVLKPPATGDKGLVEPAPHTDAMPEIRPGETPQQQPGQ